MKHISRVQPGDLVRRKVDQTIHTVASSDPGACQLRVSDSLPTSMEPWVAFEPYEPEAEPETQPELPPAAAESDPFPKGAA